MTHSFQQSLVTPEGVVTDTPVPLSADASTAVDTTVAANGGGATAVAIAFTAAGLVSLGLMASVPCVVTLTGVTVINGVTIGTVTLQANVLVHVTTITGNCTAISVGANTNSSGPAGTINIRALYNA